jgi:hypothetical protein
MLQNERLEGTFVESEEHAYVFVGLPLAHRPFRLP